jgi:Mrp family chromosome partitioning ATPase
MKFEEQKLDAEFQGVAVKMLTEQEVALTQRVEQLRGEAREVGQTVESQAELAKEVTRLERTVDRINEKTNWMKIELKSPAKVKLLQTASAPIRKEGKRQIGMTAAAGLAGFGLIGLMLVGFELRVRRVYAPADLAAVTPAGVAQKVFPVDARKLARSLATPRTAGEGAPEGEAADAACETIARELYDAQARTVLVTSPAGEENHGLLAVQLALHLHRTGLRTVLVDCNWAHPEVSAILHASDKPGVAEVLRGDLAAQHAVLRAGANGVYVLPAGRRDALSAEAAAAGRLTQLLNELQRSYDLVLIDAPAAGMSVDAVVLTRASDTVLMAVEQYRSRLPNLGQALDQLALQGQREVRYAYMA